MCWKKCKKIIVHYVISKLFPYLTLPTALDSLACQHPLPASCSAEGAEERVT